nr:hypothetical protein [Thiolinea disciformis]
MQFLHFQAMEKALGTGIVVTITLGTHAPNQPMLFEQITVIMRALLAATVAMDNDACRFPPTQQRVLQCVAD